MTLNAFGSAWGSLELTETMPLGEYQRHVLGRGHERIRSATRRLFRLEEYKLPEFKVTVQMPEENGRKKTFRARRKSGGEHPGGLLFRRAGGERERGGRRLSEPVLSLLASRRMSSRGFTRTCRRSIQRSRYYGGGQGQIIKRETLKTDATGKASLTFDTPREFRPGFRISHRGAGDGRQPARDHRQRHGARDAPALLRLSRAGAQSLPAAGQGDGRVQGAGRQRPARADRGHGEGHARLLV